MSEFVQCCQGGLSLHNTPATPPSRRASRSPAPSSSGLKTVIERVMPYWESNIQPQLKAGKTVFVAAHGNLIRAIVKFIEGIPDDQIANLEIPIGAPLVYELDMNLKLIKSSAAIPPLQYGRYYDQYQDYAFKRGFRIFNKL